MSSSPPNGSSKPITPVLAVVARRFSRSRAGRTGQAKLDLLIDAEELLAEAGASAGSQRTAALADLAEAERAGLIQVERHPRDPALLRRIRFSPGRAKALHELLGLTTPDDERETFASYFSAAAEAAVPPRYADGWGEYCRRLAHAARTGGSVHPFSRKDREETCAMLDLLPALLAWTGESYLRFASCMLCRDSKTLERWSSRLAAALDQISSGQITSLADLGIVENPRSVMLRGALRLELEGQWIDLGMLHGVSRVAAIDLERATRLEASATRCISIENETSLHELAKLRQPDLLIGTSFLGRGTRHLLERLPSSMQLFHFGDSDPSGFAVLADLRARAGRPVAALHMSWRAGQQRVPLTETDRKIAERLLESPWLANAEKSVLRVQLQNDDKGAYEQESLGPPTLSEFPYYAAARTDLRPPTSIAFNTPN